MCSHYGGSRRGAKVRDNIACVQPRASDSKQQQHVAWHQSMHRPWTLPVDIKQWKVTGNIGIVSGEELIIYKTAREES